MNGMEACQAVLGSLQSGFFPRGVAMEADGTAPLVANAQSYQLEARFEERYLTDS